MPDQKDHRHSNLQPTKTHGMQREWAWMEDQKDHRHSNLQAVRTQELKESDHGWKINTIETATHKL